jgi:regulator of replication initiation timing
MAKRRKSLSRLSSMLAASFRNLKQDITGINGRIEHLRTRISDSDTEIKQVVGEQKNLILEQQDAIRQLGEKVAKLEKRPEQAAKVYKTKEAALSDVKKILKKDQAVHEIPPGQVRITKIEIERGRKRPDKECVEIVGYGVDMSGYKLYSKKKKTFKFPEDFKVYGPVKIFTRKGNDTNTKLYWGLMKTVWNEKGDVATLKDSKGKIVSQVLVEPSYALKVIK